MKQATQGVKRKGFSEMITHKLEKGDQLVELKLDRLGQVATTSTCSKR